MQCKNCGNYNEEGQAFCVRCGHPLASPQAGFPAPAGASPQPDTAAQQPTAFQQPSATPQSGIPQQPGVSLQSHTIPQPNAFPQPGISPQPGGWQQPAIPQQPGASQQAGNPPTAAWPGYNTIPPARKGGKAKVIVPCVIAVFVLVGIACALLLPQNGTAASPASPNAPPAAQSLPKPDGNTDEPRLPNMPRPASTPNPAKEQEGQLYAITVSECLYDGAEIYVNGQLSSATPSGGVVHLDNVETGSLITTQTIIDDILYEARVVFFEPELTNLSFGEYSARVRPDAEYAADPRAFADIPQEQQPFTEYYMPLYFSTLVDAMNQADSSLVEGATQRQKDELAAWMASSNVQQYNYNYVGANFNPATILRGTDNGRPALEFLADFHYQYGPKGTNQQQQADVFYQLQMIYVDGDWRVNRWQQISMEDFNAERITEFEEIPLF